MLGFRFAPRIREVTKKYLYTVEPLMPTFGIDDASPYDLESRYSEKQGKKWRGYKVHLTETCNEDSPNFITQVETTLATDQDVTAVAG